MLGHLLQQLRGFARFDAARLAEVTDPAPAALLEARAFGLVAKRHRRKAAREFREHRIEEVLRTPFAMLRTLRGRRLVLRRRERLARQRVNSGKPLAEGKINTQPDLGEPHA